MTWHSCNRSTPSPSHYLSHFTASCPRFPDGKYGPHLITLNITFPDVSGFVWFQFLFKTVPAGLHYVFHHEITIRIFSAVSVMYRCKYSLP